LKQQRRPTAARTGGGEEVLTGDRGRIREEREMLEVEEDKVKEIEGVGPTCYKSSTWPMILIAFLKSRHSC
jgi:hypothetical protein